jgi:iron complex outermembrane recepter protein
MVIERTTMAGLGQGGTIVARTNRTDRSRTVARAVALALGTWAAAAQAQQSSSALQLEEIIVTGSRLQRPTEAGEGHAPIKTFFPEDISLLGVTNVADVLKYATQEPFRANEFSQPGGARIAQLRGLAIGNTLILINGRRVTSSATLGAGGAFNLNTIPLSAVKRIDVLSDSASAVYGTDAVGGVINIVLKNTIDEPQVDLYYGTADGGARERRASAGIGHTGDRFLFAVTADYFDRGHLLGSERDPSSNQDFTAQGGRDFRTAVAPRANIVRNGAGNLPGLNSPRATVPVGASGPLTPADFAGTAGQTNLTSTQQYVSIIPASERTGATANLSFFVLDNLTVFAEALYSKQEDDFERVPSAINNQLVPANNPFNPFGVPVNVSFQDTTPQITHAESDLLRSTLGVRSSFGTWDGELYAINSAENGLTFTSNTLDQARITQALRSADPATALNLFQDGTLNPGLLDSYRLAPVTDRFSSDQILANGYVRGPVFDLPAGALSIVIGAEYRRDTIHFEARAANLSITPSRYVRSAFTEASIPLIDANMDVPLARSVKVTAAARYDDYSDFGDTTNPQYGLEWQMFSPLLLRASYGDAYRAPTLFDLYQPTTAITQPTPDPRRGNVSTPVATTLGGNPNLQAEESNSLSGGFVYTPDLSFRPRIAGTYWRIRQEQRLQNLTNLGLLANEAFLPDRVVRGAPTPADIAAGRPGALVRLDLTKVNAGNLETNGFDLDLSMRLQGSWGEFQPQLSGTLVNRYKAADLPVSPVSDRRGTANVLGSVPDVRVTASLPWSIRGYGFAPTVRYVSSYDDADNLNVLSGTKVDSQTLVDLQASIDFETALGRSAWTEGLRFSVGALNLFNKEAPFSRVGAGQGIDPSQGELRERFVYASFSKSFGTD